MIKTITDEEFDELFDAGASIAEYVDWEHPVDMPPNPKTRATDPASRSIHPRAHADR